jgi:selenide,water dikinase
MPYGIGPACRTNRDDSDSLTRPDFIVGTLDQSKTQPSLRSSELCIKSQERGRNKICRRVHEENRLPEAVKLTATAKAAGCAAKLSPSLLEAVLRRLPLPNDPNVLVGFETSDDAGVYRVADDLALVQTIDFFTPIVDDPFLFGQIAAANALSDVYAMGGRPVTALSIVAFPPNGAPDLLEQIMRGGLSKISEAGATVVGGHSIRDDELKFGYAVTGLIDPRKIWRNVGARPGDALILTKAVGTGVISTALKQCHATEDSIRAASDSMCRLNKSGADALHEFSASNNGAGEPAVHAVTDVTGFGILGHAREMALGSGVSFRLDHTRVDYLPGAIAASQAGFLSGGLKNNRQFVEGCALFAENVAEEFRNLFYDPQTSGGLLIAVEESRANAVLDSLERHQVRGRVIGTVLSKQSPLIEVV